MIPTCAQRLVKGFSTEGAEIPVSGGFSVAQQG